MKDKIEELIQENEHNKARAAQLETERDTLREENASLRAYIDKNHYDNTTLRRQLEQAQARINDLTEWDMDTALS
jgi:hypothetical protein